MSTTANSVQPWTITAKDDALLGVAHRSDPMGTLAIWSARARDLVPHLTEQTTNVRGFQILVEAFRLWERYERKHPEHAGRQADFFLLVEQTCARTVGRREKDWPLPGRNRVMARVRETPHISLDDPSWHLLAAQRANGIWGLYRGAARRAGLLTDDMRRLSDATLDAAEQAPALGDGAAYNLFWIVERAMKGQTIDLPYHGNGHLVRDIDTSFRKPPLAGHLRDRLVGGHALNEAIAIRLAASGGLDHRAILTAAMHELPDHREAIRNAIRCEDLVSVVESVLLWLCASKGKDVEAAVADLPVDLDALARARSAFGDSGVYHGDTARRRQRRLFERLDTTSSAALARSVIELHREVSEGRGRAAWVWEDQGVLQCDVDVQRPSDKDLRVGVAWRNDYYLYPLQQVTRQLSEVRGG